ncbi:hypothetical protein NHJ13051_009353 [Beauveria bassiana]|uniref:Integral membrane protein n=2 Tax=Beauveria bassiana TaxID=176275 RepID=J4KPC7_BEAB2|nr:uncharacterized protein BBA_03798 [Beauveria bassiana ARSEF 2860]EJP67224.1 integral membrane protein [Beauveria bassiana ARSEF 2860]KAF1739708.1 hypothetical protein CRV24_001644 [Beauveria bassiana]KAH8719739.1 hypothetical protein HC256_000165 [Beauveria bassiana]KGQ04686.1 hypothetical protein BBAD15_g10073 [Beauveria bassiana D1-5]
MQDIQNDLPLAMAMAGLSSVAWYIGIEINVSLFILFKRKQGLYFWSCLIASWGVILQPIFMLLADFNVWKDAIPSIVMIYLTWFMMVVPQSWVLYSRLHLLMRATNTLQIIKYVLIFNSIVFAFPTMVIGTLAQATNVNPGLKSFNLKWDRIQLVVYFVQEISLSLLYIFQTYKYLKDIRPLQLRFWSLSSTTSNDEPPPKEQSPVLRHLIYVNIVIIVLDIILLGIQCADLFYLQAALKPCIYGLKLKAEFAILNRLIGILQRRQPFPQGEYVGSAPENAKPLDNMTLFRERAVRDGD